MRPNIAFDSILEIRQKIQSKAIVEDTKEVVVDNTENSSDIIINNIKCSGKNQKIVGQFFKSSVSGESRVVYNMKLSQRPGLDMAIKSLGLKGKVKAFQSGAVVSLKRIS